MDRITKGYMNNFAASQELTGQNESELFESFACYCVLSKEYPEHFDISDIVTGGGSDAGIDGIAIIANNVLIHSQEEFDDLAEQTHTITDLKFIFIQAKTSPTFNGGDIATFGFGVCDLLKEQPELVQNAASSKSRATGPRASDGPGRDRPQGRGSRRAFLRETGRGPHHPQLSHPDGGDRPHPAGTGRNTGVLRGKDPRQRLSGYPRCGGQRRQAAPYHRIRRMVSPKHPSERRAGAF